MNGVETMRIEQGINGLFYAVFDDSDDAWEFFLNVGGVRMACFSGYENAVLLSHTLGL